MVIDTIGHYPRKLIFQSLQERQIYVPLMEVKTTPSLPVFKDNQDVGALSKDCKNVDYF